MPAEKKDFLYLSRSALVALNISSAQVVERLEQLIRDSHNGTVWSAPKAAIAPGDGRYMMATLSASEKPGLIAVKSLLVNPKNPARGRDSINASITVMDADTGLPLAVMDGNWITAVRTAAASAVAAKRLARSDSHTLAFVGCGVQANSHLQMFCDLYPIEKIHAFGRGSQNRDALCARARAMGLQAVPCSDAKVAIADADIVVTSLPLTLTVEPFLDARWLKPGAFVAATDLALPWQPVSLTAFDKIIIDDLAQEAAMPEPMLDPAQVSGDINQLLAGLVDGRSSETERTAFIFRAVPLGDLALASLACERAVENSRGVKIDTG